MGKKRRLNRFISKWIKSDLPEERSTVLLLGVTRIPTSPLPARRPYSLPLTPNIAHVIQGEVPQNTRNRNSLSTTRRSVVRRNSSKKREGRHCLVPILSVSSVDDKFKSPSSRRCSDCRESPVSDLGSVTPTNCVSHDNLPTEPMMERSVDSIGTCSLDVEASADLTDWSEVSSVGTLRSASIVTPSPEPHLPSYLSLACTVNGYSTTTNYDPIRLARSRDASPHRIDSDLTANKATYSVQNNLLSPPNLVPLPTRTKTNVNKIKTMGENTLTQHHHQEFYSSTKTMTFMSKDSHFTSNLFTTKDSIDGCLENGHHNILTKCVSFESKNITAVNGQSKCTSETSLRQEFSNGKETKSFIQQRVERLYGPGALAQGFFVSKRQKNRLSESDEKNTSVEPDKHSKSITEKLSEDDEIEPAMKQSTSSPTLPVLRHLRPEFRAQLPIISPRKGVECSIQKSVTVPKLKDEVKVNGHFKVDEELNASLKSSANGHSEPIISEESCQKDGHYFLKILEEQTKRLLELAARIESEISTPDLSEEVIGKLRSAAGKAKLLVSQKMQQFRGLCTNNINQSVGEAFPTTNEDLQGFWDMVMLQVDQVDAIFEEIDLLRKNNWKEIDKVESKINGTNGTAKTRKVINRPRPTSAANEEARKQREIQRKKMIEERRKAMRAQQSKPRESIEIFVPESS